MLTKSYNCPQTNAEATIFKVTSVSYNLLEDKTSFTFGAFVSSVAPAPISSWNVNNQDGQLTEAQCDAIIDSMEF